MTITKKICGTLLVSSAILFSHASFATTSAWCNSGNPLKFASIGWESGDFLTAVANYIAKNGYGCDTETITGTAMATETAMANNGLQIYMEQWVGRNAAQEKAVAAGKIKQVGGPIVGGAEGWYVPDYVIHGDPARNLKPLAPDLKSVADLAKYKAVFADPEDPSKGRFLNCPVGWTCELENSQKLKAYKLTDSYNNFSTGTGASLNSAIVSAIKRGKPVLFYYWAPTPLLAEYKFVKLDEPTFNQKCYTTLRDKANNAPCGSASSPIQIVVGMNAKFYDADPVLVDFFSKINVPLDILGPYLVDMNKSRVEPTAMAKKFFETHPEVWKKWVPDDVAAKVASSLK
ncbi:ABC transporter substrate-binding protein [Glaciimonas soli]|uniref:ABC transporter substrate-binding protein n=1 Tax=Glaciimonas soli TaxID=2590999 RepID=A0A843YSW6_9BURK|nr:ABC transporter substrate-binding protein [Glaciimonas soli]MQR02665.1 ABC transporter substrate-binding protein [Glaciimonas soli]